MFLTFCTFRSMVVPEKASSFNIHPERCCSECCYYCKQKFGLLDTPLHISQMKTIEIQNFAIEYTNCNKDACLCDKCYRLVDRQARNKNKQMEASKRGELGKGMGHADKVRSCFVRNCNREVRTKQSIIYEVLESPPGPVCTRAR